MADKKKKREDEPIFSVPGIDAEIWKASGAGIAMILLVFGLFAGAVYFGFSLPSQNLVTGLVVGSESDPVDLFIITDSYCSTCNTEGTIQVAKSIFGSVRVTEFDYRTAEGKALATRLGVVAIPTYIFDDEIEDREAFGSISGELIKVSDKYLLDPEVAGYAYRTDGKAKETGDLCRALPEADGC